MLPLKKKCGRPSSGGPKIYDMHNRVDADTMKMYKELQESSGKSGSEIVRLAIKNLYFDNPFDY